MSERILSAGSTACAAVIGLALLLPSIGYAAILPAENRTEVPDFSRPDAEGKPVRPSDFKGRVLLINFWATWCHGCQTEIPWLVGFQKKYRSKGLAVVGISMDDDGWRVVRPYLQVKKLNYPVVIGNAEVGKAYGLGAMPRTVLVDRGGKIVAAYDGVVPRVSFEHDLRQLLDSPEGPRD
jgi:thiol-disulfide isomerase/thioredoxin